MNQRKQDLATFQEQQQENEDHMAQETAIYTDLRNAYLREQQAAEEAHILVSAPDFVNYVKGKGGV